MYKTIDLQRLSFETGTLQKGLETGTSSYLFSLVEQISPSMSRLVIMQI